MSLYLIIYGIGRYFIEGLRTDSLYILPGIRTAQVVSIILVIMGILGLLGIFRKLFIIKPTILFDFDGTIADTEDLIMESFRRVMKEYDPDFIVSEELKYDIIGPSLIEIFEKFAKKEDVDYLVKRYIEINHGLHNKCLKEIKNATLVLNQLKASGYKLGIVSNKRHDGIELGLKILKLEEIFEVIIGIDDVDWISKPSPLGIIKALEMLKGSQDANIYIGDTATDVKTAKNINAYIISYIGNNSNKNQIEAELPNKIITDLSEIIKIVEENNIWTYDMI